MTTTLGLISDIHGDLDSLKIALDLLRGQGVDRILCAGDLVEKGPHGDAVVQLIREQNIPCVLGNHDEAAIGNQRWLRKNADITHPAVLPRLLRQSTLDYLRELPRSQRFVWEHQRVLLVHGTPRSNVEYLLPQRPPSAFRDIARLAEADVILCGHTHTPMQAFFDGVWFFNPGSVCAGGVYESHTCATLRLPDCQLRVFDLTTGQPVTVPYGQ